ncbi:magnesium or manganese-dependent protein phosphatase [Streptomyces viridochromogenes DSM 40736]|uniref:protein-serine/threonine phosphatase n=1 Tax=Streptomyces viridochromogenes (strain DSM 40736 / JCM 4977 / BCRC 1201 / Tue 494) TaxID=591159 RepID=D9X4G3_STRVT|nr:SpoIIE family protein phosphatase [Streptomyces viridochromogenes]EFL29622.1 magnesium or manganese-dependent protein phosphatase [Streptomyces viridochromogenes DSM 40736]
MADDGDGIGVETSLEEALSATVRRTGASAAGVYLLSADEPVLGLAAVCGMPVAAAAPWWRVAVSAAGPLSEAVREDRLVWVGRQEDLARLYPNAAAGLPYQFALAFAPLHGARRWGALALVWSASHPPSLTQRERGHIQSSARRITQVLDESPVPWSVPDQPWAVPLRHPGPDAAQTGLAAADLVQRLPIGTLSLDLEGRITYLNAAAARLLGRRAERLLGTLPWQAVPWLDTPVHEDHYRTAVFSREPVAYTALRPPDVWLDFQLYPNVSGISALIYPHHQQQYPDAPAPRTTAPLGPASEGASTGRIHQLTHLAAALSQTVTVADVIHVVADQIVPAFGAQGMVISTIDAGRLKITGHRGYDPRSVARLDGLPVDTDVTPAGHVLQSGIPAFFADPGEMARAYPQAPALSGKQAWAMLPLVVSDRRVGCCVLSYDHPRQFSASDRAVLVSLGGLIAQAMDRARLYDAKHDLAHSLQQTLLPVTLPHIPRLTVAARYLPAAHGMDIGGDFYDLIRLSDTTAAAVIGDVQGHSINAAALMGQVRTAVHATAGTRPGEVLARTNRVLLDLETDLFVSCLYIHIDLAERCLHLASAGHPPPLLRTPALTPRTRVLEVEPGPLLGIDTGSDTHYPVTTAPLPPGSLLVLYTDGLVETPEVDLTESIAALARHLTSSGNQSLDALADSLIHHALPRHTHTDDIALLLLHMQ